MAHRPRGNPVLAIRMEHELLDLLKERCEGDRGRAGGMSLYVRRLIYQDLRMQMPRQWGYGSPPEPAGREEEGAQVSSQEVAEKLGMELDEVLTLRIGSEIATELKATFGLRSDLPVGEALSRQGVLSPSEGRWVDGR